MVQDLLKYSRAINFELDLENKEDSVKQLLKKWVNHRVEITPELLDGMWNWYLKQ